MCGSIFSIRSVFRGEEQSRKLPGLLGSDHDAVTFLHHVEHVATIPDRRVARFQVPVQMKAVAADPGAMRRYALS